jgi:hypothetical protein
MLTATTRRRYNAFPQVKKDTTTVMPERRPCSKRYSISASQGASAVPSIFIIHSLLELIFIPIYRRGDPRRRAHRVQTTIDSWKQQLPYLVEAYLKLKMDGPVNSETVPGGWEIEVIGLDGTLQ